MGGPRNFRRASERGLRGSPERLTRGFRTSSEGISKGLRRVLRGFRGVIKRGGWGSEGAPMGLPTVLR
eukprot:7158971-Alexandrium_andersonii.AAC.1